MPRGLGPMRAGRSKRDRSGLCSGIGRRHCSTCKSIKCCGHGVRYSPAIEVSPPSTLSPGPDGRPRRRRDDPPPTPTIVEPPVTPAVNATPVVEHSTRETPPKWVKMEPNRHGLYKVFPDRPTHDPDETVSIDDLCKSSELLVGPKIPSLASATLPWFPFLNSTVARLKVWFHVGSNLKSIAELDLLVELPAHKVCGPESDAAEFSEESGEDDAVDDGTEPSAVTEDDL
ncbi:hypothetical protein B0H19DRAFT_1377180 [Mycena capillaripes]|nr:hypothetical protein B0H19DRAFT_1377180 [Mycena capillaripes]